MIRYSPVFQDALISGDMLTIRRLLNLFLEKLDDYPSHIKNLQHRKDSQARCAAAKILINKMENDDTSLQQLISFWDSSYDRWLNNLLSPNVDDCDD